MNLNANCSQVDGHNDEEPVRPSSHPNPTSPPPSFHSRSPSPPSSSSRLFAQDDPLHEHSDADRTLADTFGDDDDDGSDEDDAIDDRQRLMRGSPTDDTPVQPQPQPLPQTQTQTQTQMQPQLQAPSNSAAPRIIRGTNDGVFANIAAKPERGEKVEDLPPVSIHRSTYQIFGC